MEKQRSDEEKNEKQKNEEERNGRKAGEREREEASGGGTVNAIHTRVVLWRVGSVVYTLLPHTASLKSMTEPSEPQSLACTVIATLVVKDVVEGRLLVAEGPAITKLHKSLQQFAS